MSIHVHFYSDTIDNGVYLFFSTFSSNTSTYVHIYQAQFGENDPSPRCNGEIVAIFFIYFRACAFILFIFFVLDFVDNAV